MRFRALLRTSCERQTARDSQSRRIRKVLLEILVLDPISGLPDTNKIGRQFTHHLAFISVHAQRKLIGVLFFWEEELVRWRLLDAEEQEILSAIEAVKHNSAAGAISVPDLHIALGQVRIKRAMRPSTRKVAEAEASEPRDDQTASLPAYSGRREEP